MALGAMERLQDRQLEREILGACMLQPELLLACDLTADDFFGEGHRRIWNALLWLGAEGEPIDTIRVRSRLLDLDELRIVGGDDYLLGLTDGAIPVAPLPTERLRRLTRLRTLHASLVRGLRACEEADLDAAVAELGNAHGAALSSSQRQRAQNLLDFCLPLLEELSSGKPSVPRVHLGYEILDRMVGSMPVGLTLAILAGPNVGKSSFALEMLLRAAMRSVVVGYISVEDQAPVVRPRIVGMLSGITSRRFMHARVGPSDMPAITRGFAEIDAIKNHFHVSVLQGGSDVEVCAAMAELKARGCKMIVVDYLQKIRSTSKHESKAHQTADSATMIVTQAQKLEVVGVLLTQRTRDKQHMNECPTKHDAKESGDIENMVDVIVGLWREAEDDHAPIWARLLKIKWGNVGASWRLLRDPNTGRVNEVEGSEHEQPPDTKGEWAHRRRAR